MGKDEEGEQIMVNNAFCTEHNYFGVIATICKDTFGYKYEFTYKKIKYFAHYPYESVAEWGARTKIEELLKTEVNND